MLTLVALTALFIAMIVFATWNLAHAPEGIETSDGFRKAEDE